MQKVGSVEETEYEIPMLVDEVVIGKADLQPCGWAATERDFTPLHEFVNGVSMEVEKGDTRFEISRQPSKES